MDEGGAMEIEFSHPHFLSRDSQPCFDAEHRVEVYTIIREVGVVS